MATYYIHGDNNLDDWGWDHNNPEDYYSYVGDYDRTNHQVVIVGWKNDNSISNGGYWIIKNSFSSEWGYNGFFNLEYGSLNIDSRDINWVDYDEDSVNNWMPKANAGGIYFGEVNKILYFDGSNSFDHEGSITSYIWYLADGVLKSGKIINHSYNQPGIYKVILTVEDDSGNSANDSTWVFVNETNSAPDKPIITGRNKGRNGTEYTYKILAFDPDNDDLFFYINWGDTYWEGRWDSWIGPIKSGEEFEISNIFDEPGNYTIRVKAKDIYDFKSDWTILKTTMSKNLKNKFEYNEIELLNFKIYHELYINNIDFNSNKLTII
jgi:C1A family cysteine protease